MVLRKWYLLNLGKCHYIVVGDDDPFPQKILIISSNEEKLLGIIFDRKLNFDSHITSLLKSCPKI